MNNENILETYEKIGEKCQQRNRRHKEEKNEILKLKNITKNVEVK